MAKNRTGKSCYESRYGGGWITPAQRLAELACERMAGNQPLNSRFWETEPWTKIYRREITLANRLLATYAMKAIMHAWMSREGRYVRTLGASFFKPLIEFEQRQLDLTLAQLEQTILPEHINTLEKPRPIRRTGKSIREKLVENGPTQREDNNAHIKQ